MILVLFLATRRLCYIIYVLYSVYIVLQSETKTSLGGWNWSGIMYKGPSNIYVRIQYLCHSPRRSLIDPATQFHPKFHSLLTLRKVNRVFQNIASSSSNILMITKHHIRMKDLLSMIYHQRQFS